MSKLSQTSLPILGALWVSACAYDFAPPDEHSFACKESNDCIDGFVCAGHTFVDSAPVSYCVEDAAATIGVRVRANLVRSTQTCPITDVTEYVVTGKAVAVEAAGQLELGFAHEDANDNCIGGMNNAGALDLLCRTPVKSLSKVKEVGVWVTVEHPAGTTWALVSGIFDDLASDEYYIAELAEVFDQNAASSCLQALNRCPGAGEVCIGCAMPTVACPAGHTCDHGTCVADNLSVY